MLHPENRISHRFSDETLKVTFSICLNEKKNPFRKVTPSIRQFGQNYLSRQEKTYKEIIMREKIKTGLLIVFVVLTLIFGSLSVFELLAGPTTLYTTATITITTSVPIIPDEGHISFYRIGYLAYKRIVDFGEGSSVTFRNVTFQSLSVNVTYTGCIVRFVKIIFQDGLSEVLQVTSCLMAFEPHVQFTNHTNPKAGVIDSYGDSFVAKGIYLLVED